MLPDRKTAEAILAEAAACNPGAWEGHSRVTAACAEKIAAACAGMDPEKSYVLGLLHDIGRKFGPGHFRHVYLGYKYMLELGYDEAAKICLTHSFVIREIGTYIGKMDVAEEQRREAAEALQNAVYDDYDRLIQLCDCLAGADGVVDMELRMQDVKRRYGSYPKEKREANLALRDYFEKKTGRDIDSVVRGENTKTPRPCKRARREREESMAFENRGPARDGEISGQKGCTVTVDGIGCRLKRPFDLGFLREYGTVFRVFDDQDSGNLCFGTEKNGARFFVKFAGAPAARYDGTPADAVARLKAAVPVYRDLRHPHLIPLLDAREIGGGFAAVFEWTDGEGIGIMYPKTHRKFMALPVGERIAVFRGVLDFFEYVAAKGYLAVDFYDGSLLYDFTRREMKVCDVDFFRRRPCVNDMGRMWGSARFLSPEETELGAALDEVTNVYTLGAAAFALFADGARTRDRWELSDVLFAVAARAVCVERGERQPSIHAFIAEWKAALAASVSEKEETV